MTVVIKQGSVFTEVGPGSVLYSWFSTVAVRLENGEWGSRFPLTMNELYSGKLTINSAKGALHELKTIENELDKLSPSLVVWDAENANLRPPFEEFFNRGAKSISRFFRTKNGLDLTTELIGNVESLIEFGGSVELISYDGNPPFV